MDTKTYTHRVAIMETRQIIMDVEAENDIDKIREVALSAYFQEEGDQEVGYSIPSSLVIYPWLEKGQTPPNGSAYPEPTIVDIYPSEDEGEAEVIEFPTK